MRQSYAHAEEGHWEYLHCIGILHGVMRFLQSAYNGYTWPWKQHAVARGSQQHLLTAINFGRSALVAVGIPYLVSYFSFCSKTGPALGGTLCIMPAWLCAWFAETKFCVTLLGLLSFELRWLLVVMDE